MANRTLSVASLMVLAACFLGCATGTLSDRPSPSRLETNTRLAELEAKGEPEAILAYVESALPHERSESVRARLELAQARALRASDRPWSALSSFHAAASKRKGSVDTYLQATVLGEWGDLEVALGHAPDAVAHYTEALALERLDRGLQRRMQGSLVVATREAGDREASTAWTKALGVDAAREIAAAEQRMLGGHAAQVPKVAVTTSASGGIPTDPRRLHASTHRRAEWDARPILANAAPMSPITCITVHHSAMEVPGLGAGRVARQIKGIQAFHVDENKWADIGYHFLIDPSGDVWEGRALTWQGAHAGDSASNKGNIGVCLLGDFERGVPVPRAQLAALTQVLDELRAYFGVPASRVLTHREWKPSTECPGDSLQQAVVAYRNSARETVARQESSTSPRVRRRSNDGA